MQWSMHRYPTMHDGRRNKACNISRWSIKHIDYKYDKWIAINKNRSQSRNPIAINKNRSQSRNPAILAMWDDIAVIGGIAMKGKRIIVPASP